MVLEHSFGDALFVQAAALLFGLVALALLGRQLWKRSELPAWQHVLSTMGIAASGLLCLLAAHDCVTKVAFIRLETEPVRLTYERAFPARRTSLEPGELRAVGLLHLGAPLEDEQGGERQILIAPVDGAELRSFVESDRNEAKALATAIAKAFGLELQRFSGPPPLKRDLPREAR